MREGCRVMMNVSMRAKSFVLAGAIALSASNGFCMEQSVSATLDGAKAFFVANKPMIALSAFVSALIALKIRLDTKPRHTYDYETISEDLYNLLGAYNLFDADSRAIIREFIDKYFVGSKLKIDEQIVIIKEEDGTVVKTKRKKLTQKPSGFMGNLDAYVLEQLEPINEILPAAAAFYVLITQPQLAWTNDYQKARGA